MGAWEKLQSCGRERKQGKNKTGEELPSSREEPAEVGYDTFVMEPVSMAVSFSVVVLGNTETT